MAKKMTLDRLAQLTEKRIQGIERKMSTMEMLLEVLSVVKRIDQNVKDINSSLATRFEVASIKI